MATLQDAQKLTQGLEDLVGELRAELDNGSKVDFEKLVMVADEISERADGMAETFSAVNDTLMTRLQQVKGGSSRGGKSGRKEQSKSASGGGNG